MMHVENSCRPISLLCVCAKSVYFSGAVHINKYHCKYARVSQEASFHLWSSDVTESASVGDEDKRLSLGKKKKKSGGVKWARPLKPSAHLCLRLAALGYISCHFNLYNTPQIVIFLFPWQRQDPSAFCLAQPDILTQIWHHLTLTHLTSHA